MKNLKLLRQLFAILLKHFRNSHRRCSVKKASTCNFIKKRLQHWCFPIRLSKFSKISKNTYFEEDLRTGASDFFSMVESCSCRSRFLRKIFLMASVVRIKKKILILDIFPQKLSDIICHKAWFVYFPTNFR